MQTFSAPQAAEPTKPRAATTRASSKDVPSVDGAQQQASTRSSSQAMPLVGRTRSQTMALARQQAVGPSMSSLLQSRSEAAVSTKKSSASVAPPSPLPNIDQASDLTNPLAATEYANDIYAYYKRVEPRFRVQPGYMARQVSSHLAARTAWSILTQPFPPPSDLPLSSATCRLTSTSVCAPSSLTGWSRFTSSSR